MSTARPRARAARALAYAKINLTLRVLARERYGYHSIETLFHRVALADEVIVRVDVGADAIDCRGADVGAAEDNLAFRAAMAFRETGWPAHVAVEVEKRIPVAAGLGGGSADAGAVLRALNALRDAPLPAPRVLELAARIGADVPYLTTEAPMALCWGRGERILVLPALPEAAVCILVPAFGVSTRDAYAWHDDARGEGRVEPEATTPDELGTWRGVSRLARNDLQDAVAARHAEISALADLLRRRGARIAQMSGSGSAVFGVFDGALTPLTDVPDDAVGDARVVRTHTLARVVPVELIE